jgi:hypothetical protein
MIYKRLFRVINNVSFIYICLEEKVERFFHTWMQPVGRRPHPVAPRQVERHNLRRIPRAQLEQAEEHGVPLQVQQPNDNDPQPAYRFKRMELIEVKSLIWAQ